MTNILVLTALPLEQNAILESLTNISDFSHPITGTIYKIGDFNSLKIIVGMTNQTNVNAGIETERAINQFSPSYIFFVGVAGGLKDVNIGDIVIGADVYGYERGKAKEEFLPRPQFAFSSYNLERSALNYSLSTEWGNFSDILLNNEFSNKINVYSGTIASGEKVDSSEKSALHKFLKTNCSHALALEMEGLGFLEACRPYSQIKTLLLRGISDLVKDKEGADSQGSQPYAAKTVSKFLFGFINNLKIPIIQKAPKQKENIFELVTKLYPEGTKDKGIWVRAGGDLSQIQISSTGKAQWIEALKLIENGGGGNIDFDSLLKEMRNDFPNNEFFKKKL